MRLSPVYVINLPERQDRRDRIAERLRNSGLTPTWWTATRGTAEMIPQGWIASIGAYGCALSHLGIYRQEIERLNRAPLSQDYVVILEDDAEWEGNLQEQFNAKLSGLPQDWDAIWFGANHITEPNQITRNIARITKAWTTHAMIVRGTFMRATLQHPRLAIDAIDVCFHSLQRGMKCYCFRPALVVQETGWSDIMEREVDYRGIIR